MDVLLDSPVRFGVDRAGDFVDPGVWLLQDDRTTFFGCFCCTLF